MIRRVFEGPKAMPVCELRVTRDDNGAPYTVEGAFAYCERIARGHYENYPVASRFVPERLRPYIWAVYAFARAADDFADEQSFVGRRNEALSFWEGELERAFFGEAEHPIFIALRETVERCDIPITPFQNLLTGFNMDLSVNRYPTFSALERYCQHAAHPVGRLILYVFNYRDPSLHRYSDDFCTALHLANFCQDIALDLDKDRVYLPAEDLAHFGVSEVALFSRSMTPAFRALMRYEVARTRALFERGRPLIAKVGRDLGFELATIWQAGMAILDKIEGVDYDIFRRRPTLNAADKARVMAKAATLRWPPFTT